MKITTSKLKSLIKESIEEVLKEQVKCIDIEGHKNLTITSDHTFFYLPEWFQKANTENAVVSMNDYGEIIWQDGIWKNGIWVAGEWEDGQWLNGTWKDGIWFRGKWVRGKWITGDWHDKKNPHPNDR